MRFYIDFETYETNFYHNWSENPTAVVNYRKTDEKIFFHIKWVWEYILVMTRDEIVKVMNEYSNEALPLNSFDQQFEYFIKKYFGNAIYCMNEQEAMARCDAPKQVEVELQVEVEQPTEEVTDDADIT